MKIKMLEIRDSHTFIPVMCIKVDLSTNEKASYLLNRMGFGGHFIPIILISLAREQAKCDCYSWNDRTYKTAHTFIEENWDKLEDGDVIDVEFILGETKKMKKSERFELLFCLFFLWSVI